MSVPDCSAQQGAESNLENMEFKRNHSELFRAECVRLITDTDTTCKRMQNDDTKQLGQRVQDIQFMTKELEVKLDEIVVEIDLLLTSQSRVAKALEACEEPLRITLLCLEERMKRFPSERRHDKADRELLKEREVIEGAILILRRAAEQVVEQLRLNRSVKLLLEHDLREKCVAQCIDNSCILMNADSPDSQLWPKRCQTLLPSLSVTPRQWENISDVNIAQAEQQLANSLYLRALLESLLEQTATDMQKQANAVTLALQLNVWDLKAAMAQIEKQLNTIQCELASQQRSREDLLMAIAERERLLNLAQARLALRLQRPSKEQCLDPAQLQLLAEVQQLNTYITKLREAVVQCDEEHRALLRCQRDLQENMEHKANSLHIDEVICAGLRAPLAHGF